MAAQRAQTPNGKVAAQQLLPWRLHLRVLWLGAWQPSQHRALQRHQVVPLGDLRPHLCRRGLNYLGDAT